MTPDRVSHEGLPLGRVQTVKGHLAALHVDRALHDGDSLQLRGAGESYDLRYSGPDVPAGGTASLRLRPGTEAKPGMQVAVWRMPASWIRPARMSPASFP